MERGKLSPPQACKGRNHVAHLAAAGAAILIALGL